MLVFGLPNGRRETTVSSTALLSVTKRQKAVEQTIVPAAFPLPRRTSEAGFLAAGCLSAGFSPAGFLSGDALVSVVC
jgi:hypothetical protein